MARSLRRILSAAAATVAAAAICGCSLVNLTGSSASGSTTFTGNYAFAAVPGGSGQIAAQVPGPVQAFAGAVANTGSALTATLRLSSTNGCVSPTTDLVFTGSISASGEITLNSSTLANNPITLTWLDDPAQSSNGLGTYVISGAGPCATPSTEFVSDGFSPVTGTWTGAFVSATGVPATVTATLTQGAANADGQFPETGTLVLTTAACTNNFSVTGLVTGSSLSVAFNPAATSSLGGFTAQLPDHVLTMTIPDGINVTGACNAGTFTGSLAMQ